MSVCVPRAVFCVLGATGSGKSVVAVQLARALQQPPYGYDDAVIVNCDISQCFADLPVATNKPTSDEMAGVPHVFVGFLAHDGSKLHAPDVPYAGSDARLPSLAAPQHAAATSSPPLHAYTVHDYVDDVTAFVERYFAQHPRGVVVVCGGTCYYAQALLFRNALTHDDDDDDGDDANSDDDDDAATLWERVRNVDAAAAARYHPHDVRRLRRLLQLHRATGVPPSQLFATRAQPQLRYDPPRCFVVVTHVRDDGAHALRVRLDARVDAMVRRGLLREAAALRARVGGDDKLCSTLRDVIGYKELAHIDDGACDVGAAVQRVKSNTRRYARQQLRWLRNRIVPQLACAMTTTADDDGGSSATTQAHSLPETHVVQLDTTDGLDARRVQCALSIMLRSASAVDASDAQASLLLPRVRVDAKAQCAGAESSGSEHCEVCDVVVYGAANVQAHGASRRHRAALQRRARERDYVARFGQPLPPPTRKRHRTC